MEYLNYLKEWGLQDYEEIFQNEGITDYSFELLDETSINDLIKKVGPRLIFKKKFREHKNDKIGFIESVSNCSTETLDTSGIYTYIPDDQLISVLTPTIAQESIKNLEDKEIPARANKKQKADSVFPKGLEAVLNKYPDGEIILMKKNKLTGDLRNKLTRIIITELFALYGKEIKSNIFIQVVNEIQSVFQSERSETYYVSYNSKTKTGPKGKLYLKYINTKAALRLANTSLDPYSPVTGDSSDNTISEEDPDVSNLDFLKTALEPTDKIFEVWKQTFSIRRKIYLNANLEKIYADFPCLRLKIGLELIETDFNRKHPNAADAIYSTWPKVSEAILNEAKERNIKLTFIEQSDSSVNALLTLPYLFNSITLKKSRKGITFRPSRSEVQESFFMCIENLDALESKIQDRRELANKFDLTVQPFGVIILTNSCFLIVVDNTYYTVDTSIRCLELLFKLFHALDIEYPPESEHIWLFIESILFKMKPKKIIPMVSTLIGDIMGHM